MPKPAEERKTRQKAKGTRGLSSFLDRYRGKDCYFDWGDDPSFFAAQYFLKDVRKASWGVCRPNIRAKLEPGDLVVFFCSQQQTAKPDTWRYYYVGFGTIGRIVQNRSRIWKHENLKPYRRFFNLLIDQSGCHEEIFAPNHKNWKHRATAPYVIFDPHSKRTHFNVVNPLHVATYCQGDDVPEKWNSFESNLTARLEQLLFRRFGQSRRLRTARTGNAHMHMNLTPYLDLGRDPDAVISTRSKLLHISRTVAQGQR